MDDPFGALAVAANGPMMIVTTATKTERGGCLVGFHSQCSIEPVRYAVWLSKANHTSRLAFHADYLGLHFLAAANHDLAELFGSQSGDDIDKFTECHHHIGPWGVPLLDGCVNRVVARRTAFLDEGSDHICFVAEPVEARLVAPDVEPLRLADVSDIEPGHQADDRPTPRSERP
jgi:flavin reductase (DIM6/NTAB) family NADH-FMN oxidoreductase RutF